MWQTPISWQPPQLPDLPIFLAPTHGPFTMTQESAWAPLWYVAASKVLFRDTKVKRTILSAIAILATFNKFLLQISFKASYTVNLTLHACNSAEEFACQDAACVPMQTRWNCIFRFYLELAENIKSLPHYCPVMGICVHTILGSVTIRPWGLSR